MKTTASYKRLITERNAQFEATVFDNAFFWLFFALVVLFSVSEMINEMSGESRYFLVTPALCRLVIVTVSFFFLLFRFTFETPVIFPALIAGWAILLSLNAAFDNFKGAPYDNDIRVKSVVDSLLWPSVCLVYYTFARNGGLMAKRMVWCFVALFLLLCGIFYTHSEMLTTTAKGEYVQSNIIYFPLLMMPWVFCLRNTLVRNLFVGLFAALALISAKRTGIAAIGLAYVTHALILVCAKKHKKLLSILALIGFVSLLAIWLRFTDRLPVDVVFERFSTIHEDQGSGRIAIMTAVLNRQKDAGLIDWLVGHGYIGTIRDLGETGHNDFIEVLYNFGLAGLLIYSAIHFILLKHMFRLVSVGSANAPSFAAAYVIFFVVSMISHLVVYPSYIIYITAFFGMMFGMVRSHRIRPINNLRENNKTTNEHKHQAMASAT